MPRIFVAWNNDKKSDAPKKIALASFARLKAALKAHKNSSWTVMLYIFKTDVATLETIINKGLKKLPEETEQTAAYRVNATGQVRKA